MNSLAPSVLCGREGSAASAGAWCQGCGLRRHVARWYGSPGWRPARPPAVLTPHSSRRAHRSGHQPCGIFLGNPGRANRPHPEGSFPANRRKAKANPLDRPGGRICDLLVRPRDRICDLLGRTCQFLGTVLDDGKRPVQCCTICPTHGFNWLAPCRTLVRWRRSDFLPAARHGCPPYRHPAASGLDHRGRRALQPVAELRMAR